MYKYEIILQMVGTYYTRCVHGDVGGSAAVDGDDDNKSMSALVASSVAVIGGQRVPNQLSE